LAKVETQKFLECYANRLWVIAINSVRGSVEDCRMPVGRLPCRDSRPPFESKHDGPSRESGRRSSIVSNESSYIAPVPGPCLSKRAAAGRASGCRRLKRNTAAVGYRALSRYWCDRQTSPT